MNRLLIIILLIISGCSNNNHRNQVVITKEDAQSNNYNGSDTILVKPIQDSIDKYFSEQSKINSIIKRMGDIEPDYNLDSIIRVNLKYEVNIKKKKINP